MSTITLLDMYASPWCERVRWTFKFKAVPVEKETYQPGPADEEKVKKLTGQAQVPVLLVNGKAHEIDVAPETPLLWVLRDTLGMTGTKFGCGMGLCGACTVHVDGNSVRSCQTPVGSVAAKKITTIEGLSPDRSHPVQKAWIAEQVPQCWYGQPGQIMQAAAFLAKHPNPTRDEIDQAMSGNICRCGTYHRIRRAIQRAAGEVA